MHRLYIVFAFLRVFLTCLPQTGYIHPDEFFQSIEIIADKSLEVEVSKPWEFNASFPIRSAVPSYVFVGLGFQLLKLTDLFLKACFGLGTIITPYCVLLFPRLVMCGLSFVVDWSLYRVCLANSEKYKSRCLVLSISYVMLTYATRTFSNTIELALFALLLYYTSESVIFSAVNVRQREYINTRYGKAETVVERAKFHKLRLWLEEDSIRSCFVIAGIIALGVFNRPTFIAYAEAPVFFWLYRGLGSKSVNMLQFNYRMIVFCLCLVPYVAFFILVDSFYFGHLTWGEIGVLEVSINNFVVTPFNFILYNMDPTNLAEHGLHPRYLHALVNIPILFNVLGLMAYFDVAEIYSHLVRGKFHYLPSLRTVKGLMLSSYLVPLAALSIFPHQEPRFLIPLILPLVYLYGQQIYPENQDSIIKAFLSEAMLEPRQNHNRHFWFKTWITINVVLCFFYGFLHQGGVLQVIESANKEIRRISYSTSYHVVTSHVYSLPRSLFLQRSTNKNYTPRVRLVLHEEGSKDLDKVLSKIGQIFDEACETPHQVSKTTKLDKCRVYLVIPTSLSDELYYRHSQMSRTDLVFSGAVNFYPHMSIEALPMHGNCLNSTLQFLDSPYLSVLNFLRCFGLARFQFTVK